jgi:hypothetical protein
MNADAGTGVAVHGAASAELPILPWVAFGLLAVGAASACLGAWLLVRGIHARHRRPASEPERSQQAPTSVSETATAAKAEVSA